MVINMKICVEYIKNFKNTIFPECGDNNSVIADYYIRIMLFLYPMYLVQDKIWGLFNDKEIIYFVLSLLSIVIFFVLIRKRKDHQFRLRIIDIYLILLAVITVILITVRLIHKEINIENEILFLCLFMTYCLGRSINSGYKYFLDLLLFSAVFLYVGMIKYYLTGIESLFGVETMLRQPEGMATWLILVCCISILLYSKEVKKSWNIFYLIMSATGFLLLFLYGDMMAACIVWIILLIIPYIFEPKVKLIKKNLILCFLFLFLFSCIPLFPNINGDWRKYPYNSFNGISIQLFLSIVGLFICNYWAKIPKNMNPDIIIMKKFQRWYGQVLLVTGIVLTVCILTHGPIADLPDKFGIKILKVFSASFVLSIQSNKSFFQFLLEEYGLIGGIFWIHLAVIIINRLRKQWKKEDSTVKVLTVISIVFLVQTFFYRLQPISTPMYVVFLTFALYANRAKGQEYG